MKRKPYVNWFNGHLVLAAIMSFFLPGIPHILMGEWELGLVLFIITVFAYWFLLGWVVAIFAGWHAYSTCENVYATN